MSSTGRAISSTSSIIAALDDYAKKTGLDLPNNPFVARIKQSNSPQAILELLQEREKTFKEYRDSNRKLISCLSPVVKVLQALSGILSQSVSLVSQPNCQVGPLT